MVADSCRIAIIGNGGWGNAVALLLAERGHKLKIWGHDREYLKRCESERENKRYLPGIVLPQELSFEPELERACQDVDIVISAVPSSYLRSIFSQLRGKYPKEIPLISLTKGIENESLSFPSEILVEETEARSTYVLSGPTMAEEVARKKPTSAVLASEVGTEVEALQALFHTDYFRVYTSEDKVGVELSGAVKNVIAIAAGICDGMGLGDNAKAAMLARGLAELCRLGAALGAREQTFLGLSGIGDMYTTCASPYGRNRSFGENLGKGLSFEEAQEACRGMVVEGVRTAHSLKNLTQKLGVEMPISEAVYRVLFEEVKPEEALQELLARPLTSKGEVFQH